MKKNEDTYETLRKSLSLIVYGHMLALKTISKMGKVDS